MAFNLKATRPLKTLTLLLLTLSLSACDFFQNLVGSQQQSGEDTKGTFRFAAAPHAPAMPWFLANENGTFEENGREYNIDLEFVATDYSQGIDQFINQEVEAVSMTNVDAIVQLIRRDILANIILVSSYSQGNDAIVLKSDEVEDIKGKTIGVLQESAHHYLLERYLIKNQIPFDAVERRNTPDIDIFSTFKSEGINGLVTSNPYVSKLVQQEGGTVIFDSSQIPKEILQVLVVRRDVVREHPEFAQALIASWFSIMSQLQGTRRGGTIASMAEIADVSPDQFGEQINAIFFYDNPIKALSGIRDYINMRDNMQHIKYFIERNELGSSTVDPENWISYPGRKANLLHYDAKPLEAFTYDTFKKPQD